MSKMLHAEVNKAIDLCKMDKIAERAVNQKKDLAAKDSHTDMVASIENDDSSIAIDEAW